MKKSQQSISPGRECVETENVCIKRVLPDLPGTLLSVCTWRAKYSAMCEWAALQYYDYRALLAVLMAYQSTSHFSEFRMTSDTHKLPIRNKSILSR
jgi:hypothetical protein